MLNHFHKDKSKSDGVHTICKDCRNISVKKVREKENKEILKVKCNICNQVVSNESNLKLHQNTKKCKKHELKFFDHINK